MSFKYLRCTCGDVLDFIRIRKCAGCGTAGCWDCIYFFRARSPGAKRYCKPCRKQRADAASRGEAV